MVGLMPALRARSRTSETWLSGHQGHDRALVAGAGRTAGAVQVRLVLDRRVGVDDQRRRRRRGCRAPRCRWRPAWSRCRRRTRRGCGCARSATGCRAARPRARPSALSWRASDLGAVLGAGEDDRATGCGGQVDQHREPRVLADVQHVVGHAPTGDCAESTLCVTGLFRKRLTSTSTPRVQGGGEQHPLAAPRRRVEQALDDRQEAEVGHVVGLVEHGDLDGVEVGVTAAEVVLEPAGAGDDDVDAVAQAADLRARADAAEDGERAQAERPGQRGERPRRSGWPARGSGARISARGRPGRRLRDAARRAGPGRAAERVGLAGAGAAAAEHVAPGERVGQRGGLDREGLGDAELGEHADQRVGDAERLEGRAGMVERGADAVDMGDSESLKGRPARRE